MANASEYAQSAHSIRTARSAPLNHLAGTGSGCKRAACEKPLGIAEPISTRDLPSRPYGGTMDKKLAGLLGAAAALTTMTAAKAAPAVGREFPQVSSHRDLLDPIPNALPLLKADEQRLAQNGGTRTAQVVIGHHQHHHGAGVYVRVGPRAHRHHHHHHHHHHYRVYR